MVGFEWLCGLWQRWAGLGWCLPACTFLCTQPLWLRASYCRCMVDSTGFSVTSSLKLVAVDAYSTASDQQHLQQDGRCAAVSAYLHLSSC